MAVMLTISYNRKQFITIYHELDIIMTCKMILIQLSQNAFNIAQLNYDCSMFVNISRAKQVAIY